MRNLWQGDAQRRRLSDVPVQSPAPEPQHSGTVLDSGYRLRRVVYVAPCFDRFLWTLGCGHQAIGLSAAEIGTLVQCWHCE